MRYKIKKDNLVMYENYTKALYRVLSELKTPGEVKKFIDGLLSQSEQLMLARRIVVLKMLITGAQYRDIENKLNIGPDTIREVKRFLVGDKRVGRAAKKGYTNTSKQPRSYNQSFSSEWRRFMRKYPSRNLLLHLLTE